MPIKRKRRAPRYEEPDLDWLLWPWDALKAGLAAVWQNLRTQRHSQVLLLILLAAAGLRLVRPDWYTTKTFHPDERWLFDKTASLSYPAEPGKDDGAGLQYGSLPLYTVGAARSVVALVSKKGGYEAAIVSGRTVTGLVDTITVLATWLLALPLAGPMLALLAAFIVAMAPLHIQLAHFFTVDPWLACFATLMLAVCVRLVRKPSYGLSVLAGVLYGAAMASKSSGLPLGLSLAIAHFWPALAPGLKDVERRQALMKGLRFFVISLVTAGAAFFVFMPWALLHWSKFVQNQTAQREILVTGSPAGVPFVRQYWDTGVGFHLKGISLFYLGLPTGLLALLALPFAALRLVRGAAKAWAPALPKLRKSSPSLDPAAQWQALLAPALILGWILPYFAIVGFSFAKFARYMLPLLPALVVLLVLALPRLQKRWNTAYKALVALILLAALGHGLGYGATYFRSHPWIEASAWSFKNIPSRQLDPKSDLGMRVTNSLNEDWGDDLPVDVDGQGNQYHNLKGAPGQVNIVEWDSPNKLARLSLSLSQADVLYLADARAYGTYLRLPTRFPLTHTYYELLFHDPARLGFELVHEASNPIRLFGFGPALEDSRIPSVPRWRWADESFTLYDRPHTFVFKRVRPMTEAQVNEALMARLRELRLSEAWMNGIGPEELAKGVVAVGPKAELKPNPNFGLSRGTLKPLYSPVLSWWLLSLALGLLALPLCAKVFGRFPDGGYALSKALGLFLFGWLAYNLAWLKLMAFTQTGLMHLLAGLAVVGLILFKRQEPAARAWFRAHRLEILFTEGLFAVAFLFFVGVRAFNPNIHDITGQGYFGGGEPLGMTYLSALSRCATFPAFDPWLAPMNSSYYYFGHVLAAALTKLSGFPPAITYNLSLALFFALTLLSAYGLLRALVPSRKGALAGALMVGFAGSLWSLSYLVMQVARSSGFFWAWFSHGFIWDPTRFPELVNGHIFEFPYFSFLYSDLHPHSMALPFSLVLLALFLVPFLAKDSGWRSVGADKKQAGLWLFLAALLLDGQYALNSWSWPVFLALGLGAMAVGPWVGRGLKLWDGMKAAAWGLGLWAVSLVVGRVAMTGFRRYFIQDGGNRLGHVVPNEWQMSTYIPLAYYFAGLLALAFLAGFTLKAWGQSQAASLGYEKLRRRGFFDRWLTLLEKLWSKRPVFTMVAGLGLLTVAGLLLWSLAVYQNRGVWALALGLGLACLGLFALGGHRDGKQAFLWMLGAFTFFLVAGCERYFVADRMNTIFKFWFNGWVLMGLVFGAAFNWIPAAAVPEKGARGKRRLPVGRWAFRLSALGLPILLLLLARLDVADLGKGGKFFFSFVGLGALFILAAWTAARRSEAPWFGPVLRGVLVGALGLGLLYPLGATVGRIKDASGFTDPHLNGLDFMGKRDARPNSDAMDYDSQDHGLIVWLNENADVTETLLEAPGLDLYKGYSRFAIYTGLPTLLGWDYQVGQQLGERAGNILPQRKADAAAIYNGTVEEAKILLKAYKVRWIVVGVIERRVYKAEGLEKFASMAKEVKAQGSSKLYRFDWER